MSHRPAAHALRTPIALGPPLYRRLASALAAAVGRRAQVWRHQGEQRAARRWVATQRAALAELDARTLRDIGLGDWVTPRSQERGLLWSETQQRTF